jgi:hypothetical protein
MTSATLASSTLEPSSGTAGPARPAPDGRMVQSRVIGALFLAGFLAYGTGFGLVSSVIGTPDFLTTIGGHQTMFAVGAVLMLLTIVTDVWRAVVFFPVLGERGRSTALTYMTAQIISVMLFFVGVLSLLLLVPLGQHAADAGGVTADWAAALGGLLVQYNANAYQVAQMALAFGSLSLWTFGLRTRLIPRAFAGWAVVGYILLMIGSVAELFGLRISMFMLIPGALFEVALPFWLFFRGFNADAYGKAE